MLRCQLNRVWAGLFVPKQVTENNSQNQTTLPGRLRREDGRERRKRGVRHGMPPFKRQIYQGLQPPQRGNNQHRSYASMTSILLVWHVWVVGIKDVNGYHRCSSFST